MAIGVAPAPVSAYIQVGSEVKEEARVGLEQLRPALTSSV